MFPTFGKLSKRSTKDLSKTSFRYNFTVYNCLDETFDLLGKCTVIKKNNMYKYNYLYLKNT